MFNRNVPAFYNPRLDVQSREETFLLKRRIRLMEKLHALAANKDRIWYTVQKERIERQLKETEVKLGIKQ